jgi:hypothetical protein
MVAFLACLAIVLVAITVLLVARAGNTPPPEVGVALTPGAVGWASGALGAPQQPGAPVGSPLFGSTHGTHVCSPSQLP